MQKTSVHKNNNADTNAVDVCLNDDAASRGGGNTGHLGEGGMIMVNWSRENLQPLLQQLCNCYLNNNNNRLTYVHMGQREHEEARTHAHGTACKGSRDQSQLSGENENVHPERPTERQQQQQQQRIRADGKWINDCCHDRTGGTHAVTDAA